MVLTHENIQRRMEHWDLIRRVDPYQLKFCGKKSIRGAYNVIGISSIASNATPFLYFVNEGGRSNSEVFTDMVLYAISHGFLRRGDVLVLNNATYHRTRNSEGEARPREGSKIIERNDSHRRPTLAHRSMGGGTGIKNVSVALGLLQLHQEGDGRQ